VLYLHRTFVRLRETDLSQGYFCETFSLFYRSAFFIALIIAFFYSMFGPVYIPFINSTEIDAPNVVLSEDMQLPENFFILFPLADEPLTNWTMSNITETDLKQAIDAGKEALGDREIIEETILAPVLNSPSYRHQRAVSTTREARIESKRGYVEDHATRFLAKKFKHERKYDKRRDVGQGPNSNLDKKEPVQCGSPKRYRSYDGSCNNRENPRWGSSYIPFRRALNSDYCDGISSPRCATDGTELSSAREVSITVHRPSYYTDPHFSVMLAVWGQFLDHDITATASNQAIKREFTVC
jgi:peroxidase